MQRINTKASLQQQVNMWQHAGQTIALVPTMGALHAGHLSLVELAKQQADRVIVSIFVNPTQFAPHEDFDHYPRDIAADMAVLSSLAPDVIYTPNTYDIYDAAPVAIPFEHAVAHGLESDARPHFFHGVTTIVRSLFEQASPTVALFGEKDYQQLCCINTMVAAENLAVCIVGGPTLREPDGLAMSSRNVYLSAEERAVASQLYTRLQEIAVQFTQGEPPEKLKSWAVQTLLEDGFADVHYIAIREEGTLAQVQSPTAAARVLGAVTLGKTRLLDNVTV